jgi:hypothetical protein
MDAPPTYRQTRVEYVIRVWVRVRDYHANLKVSNQIHCRRLEKSETSRCLPCLGVVQVGEVVYVPAEKVMYKWVDVGLIEIDVQTRS